MTTDEAMRELKAAWRDFGILVLVTLANTWLGRKVGLHRAVLNWLKQA